MKENTGECNGRSGKAVVVGSFTDVQRVLLKYICVFVDGENLAESEQPVRDPPVQCVYTSLPLPDQIVHSFVVVQDGTAILSVVLQRDATVDSTAKRAGL